MMARGTFVRLGHSLTNLDVIFITLHLLHRLPGINDIVRIHARLSLKTRDMALPWLAPRVWQNARAISGCNRSEDIAKADVVIVRTKLKTSLMTFYVGVTFPKRNQCMQMYNMLQPSILALYPLLLIHILG
ncbi:hypothetical protein HBI81_076870 [Parastagonospora nodorum]|nr:hypothetical protein HBH92_059170 [Parastagonospora nodorum]KAH4549332.1 hypothetical protein HBH85_052500 [Parastagonospora nodorum]KAH4560679.1 hypothetical protein HBH86_066840 [Parastagonospora nodorum]KAH4878237.1 hypothetical protein HBH59_071000 [Parastagonospora nodorum]KAH4878650.1 hypothetical protein HBH58_094320 [Parastagonospora nodorum]